VAQPLMKDWDPLPRMARHYFEKTLAEVKMNFIQSFDKIRLKHEISRRIVKNNSNKDCIFVWIPKSAGSSFMRLLEEIGGIKIVTIEGIRHLRPNNGIYSFGHISLMELVGAGFISSDYFHRAFKFTIVRNPYDRAVSLFEYLKKMGNLPPTTTFSIFCQYLKASAFEPVGLYNHKNLNQLNPQVDWLKGEDGNIMCDYIGKFEDLSRVVLDVSNALDVKLGPLEKSNTSNRKKTEDYYSLEQIEIINQVYDEDFVALGYEKR
jgi:chondroitin 4-sulfotransferase 11